VSIVVQKYGGSSVADVERIGGVADRVVKTRARGHDVVVVVSAMGGTTDSLLDLAHQVDESPPRRELDMLLSTGERITMALLSMAIQKRGQDAISFTGSQSGIITNDRHFDARIIDVRPHRVEDELARGKVVIIAGYQGMSYKREITTLGRGGSDTTALAMAAALGAERAEIYSDVDGVYSADPRVVPEAKHLEALGYAEMQEMAESGAKVLHAQAVEFARRAGIRIHARSTFGGDAETRIGETSDEGPRAVVGKRGVAWLRGEGAEQRQAARAICGAALRDWVARGDAFDAVTHLDEHPDFAATFEALTRAGVKVDEGLGVVSVVSRDCARDPAIFARFEGCLGAAGIETRRVLMTPSRLSALVDGDALDEATRRVHAAVVGA